MDISFLAESFTTAMPLVLAETSALSGLLNGFWLAFQVAVGLGFVIFVHELGHFLAAKTFGVRCDKFYVGFDVPISIGPIKLPSTLGKFQWGETEYGIGIIPLGGYVKMLGQDDDPRKAEEEAAKIRENGGEDAPLDPRSYPAKPVWQRMIIISAGVVMNLIFAVILAGIAYRLGVNYTPTVAGATNGGGPAWQTNLQPGDQILSLDGMEIDDKLRYDDFRMNVIMRGFEGQAGWLGSLMGAKSEPPTDLPLILQRDGQRIETTITPTPNYSLDRDIYLVGMTGPTIPKVAEPSYQPFSYLESQKPDLQPGDIITAVNGDELPTDDRYGEVLGSELTKRLQATWEDPVRISISRPAAEPDQPASELEIELPPVPVNSLGLGFAMGPITAIQSGSQAEAAGLRVGDLIQKINGQEITNALKVPSMAARLAGETVELEIVRGKTESESGEVQTLSVQSSDLARFDPISGLDGHLTLGTLGIAFQPTAVIGEINTAVSGSDTSSSAEDGIQVGDELAKVHWQPSEEVKQKLAKVLNESDLKPLMIDEAFNIASMYDLLQTIPVDSTIQCTVRRDGVVKGPFKLQTAYADDWYWHQRGIGMTQLTQVHQVDSVTAAAQLGFWETSQRFSDVLNFLKLLATGRIGMKGVGGPVGIAQAAASEASNGVSRLMIFLTLLSANLAILNFLPIPALDGGHMVFLTAEAIRGKPVSEALQIRLTMIGVLGLLSLMAFVIVKDIIRIM